MIKPYSVFCRCPYSKLNSRSSGFVASADVKCLDTRQMTNHWANMQNQWCISLMRQHQKKDMSKNTQLVKRKKQNRNIANLKSV